MSLKFGFNVGVRSGHHRHPNTVEAAEMLQECIHFFGPLSIINFHILYVWKLFQPTGHPDGGRTSSIFSSDKTFRATPSAGKVVAAFYWGGGGGLARNG